MFSELISLECYNTFLIIMAAIALVVFVALYFVEAGYGYLFNPKYGFPVDTVELSLWDKDGKNKLELDLQRDLSIAISE